MCGIVGIIHKGHHFLNRQIRLALHQMELRGPDDEGVWQKNGVALGHRRLSIIDMNGGKQPMSSADGRITIVVNGELYGYREIRQTLSEEYHFQTKCDSEILIPLYLKYGAMGMMKHLRGEFAFILYDNLYHTLIAARDRFGIKPLCWYKNGNKVVIASKAKAILACGIKPEWDDVSLMQSLTMHYQPTDRTFFKNIHQVRPGHILVSDEDANITDYTYWDINYPNMSNMPVLTEHQEREAIHTLHDLLLDSVKTRMISDVPVCCHLSGGLDSSTIAGMMATVDKGSPVHCFSIVFPHADNEYNEEMLAEETVRRCGGVLHKINISQGDILDNLPQAVFQSEGLAVNGHLSCKYLLNKAIRKEGFKVALTGEGADECLAGYPHLRQDMFAMLPEKEREILTQRLYSTNLAITGTEIASGNTLNCDAVRDRLGYVPSFISAKASIGHKMYALLNDDVLDNYTKHDCFAELLDRYDINNRLKGKHPVNQSLYLWSKLTLCNYILGTLGDGCEMAFSIEGRLPFLDHRLFEYAAGLPMQMKIRNYVDEKYILKEAARPYITDNIYHRQKHPFQAPPLTRYFSDIEYQKIVDTLSSMEFRSLGIFNNDKIADLMHRLRNINIVEQTAYEPVVMLLLTINYMNQTLIKAKYEI